MSVGSTLAALGGYPPALHDFAETQLPTAVWLFGSALVTPLIFGRQRRQY